MEKQFYSPEEIAKILGVSRQTIYNWLRDGALVASKLKRTIRISQAELDRQLSENRTMRESSVEYNVKPTKK